MSQELAALQVSLELQSAQFTAEMAKVNGQLNRLNKDVGGMAAGFNKLGTVLKGAAVLGAFIGISKALGSIVDGLASAIDAMDEMSKASQKVGVTVETLSSLKFAADQSGVSFEALQTGLKKLNQNLADFDTGTTEAATALRKFGVAVGDDTQTALGKIANVFADMPDGVQKTAAAMEIFGKSGADLIPLLNAGAKGIEELQKRAKELGIVFDDISAKQAELFNDKMAEMKTALTGVYTQISIGLLPVLSALTEELADSIKTGTGWQTVGEQIGEGLLSVAQGAAAAVDAFIALQKKMSSFASSAVDIFTLIGTRGRGKEGTAAANRLAESIMGATPDQVVTSYSNKMKEIIDGIRARMDVGEFQDLGRGSKGSGGGAGGAGKGEKTPFDSWLESLQKAADEITLLTPKAEFLSVALDQLREMGLEGSATWKAYTEELTKVQDKLGEGNPFYKLEQDIAKARVEMDNAKEALFYLVEKLEHLKSIGDQQGVLIVEEQIKKLTNATKDTATEMEKLGKGIEDAIASNANNAVNTFIDSIGQAKISFGDFATAVLKDIAKMIVRMLILAPLMKSIGGLFSFGGGGGAQAFPVDLGRSLDGLSRAAPTPFNTPIGDYPTGGTIPNFSGVMAARAANPGVKVEVNNYAQAEVSTQQQQNADGSTTIRVLIEKHVKDMVNNGGLDRSMRGAYGLTRVGA